MGQHRHQGGAAVAFAELNGSGGAALGVEAARATKFGISQAHEGATPQAGVDPEQVFTEARRRALTPEEAGRLLACFPLFWWDHMLTLLGTGLGSASWPDFADAGSTFTAPCPCSRSAPPATRPAGSAAALSPAPRATPASARYP